MQFDDLAADFIAAGQALANYRPTFLQAVEVFAVGTAFACDEDGPLCVYRRTNTKPGYQLIHEVPSRSFVESKVSAADLAAPDGAERVGFQRAAPAIIRSVEERLRDTLHAADFGVRSGAAGLDNTARLQAAIDYTLANSIDRLLLPSGRIDLSGDVVLGVHSEIGNNYLSSATIEGSGSGVNGSWLRFTTGTLIVNAPSHSLRNFRVTSLDGDGIHVRPGSSTAGYPARSEMVNIRAEYCEGSGIVISDNWLYLMTNIYSRQNKAWGIEGRNGPLTGLACNSWTIIGGEIQGNGTIGGSPLRGGGSLKSTGGGVYTGRSVQMNLHGVTIEGNKGDGIVIGEQTRGLLLSGCYFELNGSHQDDRDIRNSPTINPANAPNSIIIENANFTPQAANGAPNTRAIELIDCIDVKIINPQVFDGPERYAAEPIRIAETQAGRSSGWVEGGWYSSALYTQPFLKNDCERYGFPQKHVFSPCLTMPSDTTTISSRFTVPVPATAGSRVSVTHLTRRDGSAIGNAKMTTRFRFGPMGTTWGILSSKVTHTASHSPAQYTSSHDSNAGIRGTHVEIEVSRLGEDAADTMTSNVILQCVEIITYEGLISSHLV